jgi:hypothetical protein
MKLLLLFLIVYCVFELILVTQAFTAEIIEVVDVKSPFE